MEINKVRKGETLITEEIRYGRQQLVYGPVMIIDLERGEIGIKTEDGVRSFRPEQLSTISTFVNNCRSGKSSPSLGLRTLMGYIMSVAEGQVNERTLREIVDEFKKQGVKPVASQEVLDLLVPIKVA